MPRKRPPARPAGSPRKGRGLVGRRWWLAPIALIVIWLGGDFVYSRIVLHRLAQWERTVTRESDGVRAGCREYDLGQGSTALLWIHGFNDCPAIFERLVPRVAEHGFACRVMRLPGFALPVDDYARTSHDQWLEAMGREVERLAERHERIGIVTHSMGGAIAVEFILDHQGVVDGAALLAPLVRVSRARSPVLAPRTWHSVTRRALIFTQVVETPFPIDANSAEARAYDSRTRFTPRPVFDELYALIASIEGRAAEFDVPLLMVLGGKDEVIDGVSAEQFYRESSSPLKRIAYYESAGHNLPLEDDWEQLADEIARFFEELPANAVVD